MEKELNTATIDGDHLRRVLRALHGQISSFKYFRGENPRLDVLHQNVSEILNNNHVNDPAWSSSSRPDVASNSMEEEGFENGVIHAENLRTAIQEIKLQTSAFSVFTKGCKRLQLFIQIIDLIVAKLTDPSGSSTNSNSHSHAAIANINNNTLIQNDKVFENIVGNSDSSNCHASSSSSSSSNLENRNVEMKLATIEATQRIDNNNDTTSGNEALKAPNTQISESSEVKRGLSALVSQVNQEIEALISVHSVATVPCATLPYAKIRFRRIRIGSYELSKVVPSNSKLDLEASATYISDKGILFCMYHSSYTNKLVRIILPHCTIKTIIIRVGLSEVTLNFRTGTQIARFVREKLGMKIEHRESKGWFDPEGGPAEKSIWFIGKPISQEQLNLIERMYYKKVTISHVSSSTNHN